MSPSGLAARIRSIHAQNRPVERGAGGRALRAQSCRRRHQQGRRRARRHGARSGAACADRPHRRDASRAFLRDEADRAVDARAAAPCRLRCRGEDRAPRRRSDSARRRSLRSAGAGKSDRGLRGRPLRAARHDRAADDRRRPLSRSARPRAQAAHARAAAAADGPGDHRSGAGAGRAPRLPAILRRPVGLRARPRARGERDRRNHRAPRNRPHRLSRAAFSRSPPRLGCV